MAEGITLQEMDEETIAELATKDEVGSLSDLLTTSKNSTVAAINELFTNVSNGKTSVAAAITGKGVAASGSDTFAVLAAKIGQIVREIPMGPGEILLFQKVYSGDLKIFQTYYTRQERYTIHKTGVYRAGFMLGASGITDGISYGRIYRNGAPYGLERFTSSYGLTQYTEDLYFKQGDTIELWCRNNYDGSNYYGRYTALAVYGDTPLFVTNN
ncbi:hypothetical protein HMSSN139_13950 [Paenibacillus sp. HMSSN-139]|nr:hypothetical protein HMSSN139_13950 [Paenibacillus sp. HMSSN-139]